MACNLNTTAYFEVPVELQRWMCPHLPFSAASTPGQSNPFDTFPENAWSEDWGSWDTANEHGSEKVHLSLNQLEKNPLPVQGGSSGNDRCWLTECLVSMSPTGDVMALARESRVAIFTGVWEVPEDAEERLVMKLSWKGVLDAEAGVISCLSLLPVSSLQRSSAGAPDFTCLMVCHKGGSVRWYTLEGALLLQKMFEGPSEGAICAELYADGTDEHLALLFPRNVVTIDARQLTTLLRICVNKLAKASAAGERLLSSSHVPPLPFQKWALPGRGTRAVAVAGTSRETLYDVMASASLAQTSYSRDAAIAALNTGGVSLLAAGEEPFVAAVTGRVAPSTGHVSDVARQLASAVTSRVLGAASSWLPFVGAKPADEKVQDKVEPGSPVAYRWTLPEGRRCAASVSVSPDPRLAAVTDNFGRVVLLDVQSGYAVRMWKGYRDAVVSWAWAQDGARRALFVVLLAPRRGLLEVWPAQHGPRVAAFNVPRAARLVYTGYGPLGGGGSGPQPPLLLCPDGTVQQLTVPLHLAMGGRTGKRARDAHLLKTFKGAVRRASDTEAAQLCRQLLTSSGRLQALSFLAHCPCVYSSRLLEDVLAHLLPVYLGQQLSKVSSPCEGKGTPPPEGPSIEPPSASSCDEDCLKDKDTPKVKLLLRKLRQLLKLHAAIYGLHPKAEEAAVGDNVSPQHLVQELCHRLALSTDQLDGLVDGSDQPPKTATKVTFSEGVQRVRVNLAWFVRSFELGVARERPLKKGDRTALSPLAEEDLQDRLASMSGEETAGAGPVPIFLQDGLSSDRKAAFSLFLFGWPWSPQGTRTFHRSLLESGVDCKGLLKLLLLHWCTESRDTEQSSSACEAPGKNKAESRVPSVGDGDGSASGSSSLSSERSPTSEIGQESADISPEKVARIKATLKMASILTSLTSVKESEIQCSAEQHSLWWNAVRSRLVSWSRLRRAFLFGLASRALNTKMEVRQRRLESSLPPGKRRKVSHLLPDPPQQTLDEDGSSVEHCKDGGTSFDTSTSGLGSVMPAAEDATPSVGDPDARKRNLVLTNVESSSVADNPAPNIGDENDIDVVLELFEDVEEDTKRAVEAVPNSGPQFEWEGCSSESSEWAALLGQLERLLPLERLLCSNLSRFKGEYCDVSVKMLLDKGKGGLAEVVARWLVRVGFSAAELTTLAEHVDRAVQSRLRSNRDDSDCNEKKQEQREEDSPEPDEPPMIQAEEDWEPDMVTVYDRLVALSEEFPESLSRGSLQTNLSWEAAAAWQHGSHDPELLQRATSLAATIPNCHVKHGLTSLVWEKWVGPAFRRVSEAVERIGSVPAGTQCLPKAHMPRHSVPGFLLAAQGLLQHVMESSVRCEVEKPHIPNVDSFWQYTVLTNCVAPVEQPGADDEVPQRTLDQSTQPQPRKGVVTGIHDAAAYQPELHQRRFLDRQGDGRPDVPETRSRRVCGPKSLVEVAVLQKATSYDLVFVHCQLVAAVRLIASLDMTGYRPHGFFSDRCRSVLHKSLHLQWSLGGVDEAASVSSLRIKFLSAAVTSAIASLSDQPSWQEFQNCGANDAIALGRLWGVGQDHLHRYQVIELYSFGHDDYAQDCIRLVSNSKQLAQNLLLLAACRYKYLIDSSARPAPLTVTLGASVAHWIKSLSAEQLKNPSIPVEQSIELMHTVIRLLPTSSADHDKAESLLYAFTALKETAGQP